MPGDSNFRWRSVDECLAAARPVYELLGRPDNITWQHPDCAHSFPEEMRQEAYQVIESVLWPKSSP